MSNAVAWAQGGPARLNISAPNAHKTVYKGSARAITSMAKNPQPISMATADFDSDGIGDLAIGFAAPNGGYIAVHRGNLDAFAPQSDASFWAISRGEYPAPYLPEAELIDVPARPDFLTAGDFIGHSGSAVALAARGGQTIYVLSRAASGKLELQQTLTVGGSITAIDAHVLSTGKYGQLAVGVQTENGPLLAIYSGSPDGLVETARFPLSGSATAFASGNLDGDATPDLLVIAGGQPNILHGGSGKLEALSVPFIVTGASLGRFRNDRDPLFQMALMASDGSVVIMANSAFDSTPFTFEELQAKRRTQIAQNLVRASAPVLSERQITWKQIESYPSLGISAQAGVAPLMLRARISDNGTDDLIVLGAARLSMLTHDAKSSGIGTIIDRGDLGADAVAAVAVRVSVDARPGVVYVERGRPAPVALVGPVAQIYTVNTTADLVSGNANACKNAVAGQCSLRQAIIEANANSPATDSIMVPAGTYTLTIARNCPGGTCAYDAKTGTLDVTDSVNIIGAAQATTIIQGGSSGATAPNGVDKVFSFNQDIIAFTDASVAVSNLTIQNGFNRGNVSITDGWGGAFDVDTGTSGNASLTLTNVTINSNTFTQGEGGGFAAFNSNAGTGNVGLTNCIVQNNIGKPDAVGTVGDGGGIWISNTAKVSLTTSQVTGNQTKNNGGVNPVGAGISSLGSLTIHGGAVSNNTSVADGGGIYSNGSLTIDQTAVLNGNVSSAHGGAIWFAAASTNSGSLSKITITGNSATSGGGVYLDSGNQAPFSMRFSRLASNVGSTSGSNFTQAAVGTGSPTINITDDWWGTNSPSGTISLGSGVSTSFSPNVVLTFVANPTTVKINQTSALSGDLAHDSNGSTATLSGNLAAFVGVTDSFNSGSGGSITTAQITLDATAKAIATFTAGGTGATVLTSVTVDAATASASIFVLQPPSMTMSFSPTVVAPGISSQITFSVTNGNTTTIDANFSDTLPSGLVVASTPGVVNGCGGTVTAVTGAGTISFTTGSLAVGTCTIKVNVSSVNDNTYNNSATINSSVADNGNTPSATLTVVRPPSIAQQFGSSTVTINSSTSLTLTLSNPNGTVTLGSISFTDTLPAGLVVATPNSLTNGCGGTPTAVAGSGTIGLSGVSLTANGSCMITVNVTGTTLGQKNNTVSASDTVAGSGSSAPATVLVIGIPAAVTTNPTNTTVAAGNNATFTAAASGTPAPTVQWQVSTGGPFTNISGATATTLTLNAVTVGMTGNQYQAVFTNTVNSVVQTATTTAATLTVTAVPVVTTQPTGTTVNAGTNATFTAAASGTPAPTVQWQVSTGGPFSDISGATSTTLTINAVTAGMNGNMYHAVFTNSTGSATSNAATLTVNFAPSVTTNPVSQSITSGGTVIFTAAASGNPSPTVQWQISTGGPFTNISGATSTTLSFVTNSSQNGNQYQAVFTNSVGNATTTAATLTVNTAPVVTTQPTNTTVNAGTNATFAAAASGTPAPTVQWQVSTGGPFSNISGATSTTLTLSAVTAGMNGNMYRAVFTNSVSSATSNAATLTVNFGPSVTTNPISTAVNAGSNATFTAAATGNPSPTVQWQVSTGGPFSNISGATSTTFTLSAVTAGMNGNQYQAVFTNSVGNATTTAATLIVNSGPVVTTQPTNQTVNAGANATFTAGASGNPSPTVQWQVSTGGPFSNISGATSTTLTISGVTVGMSGNQYHAIFTNSVSAATSNAATLTVTGGPTVVSFSVLWGIETYNVTANAGARNRLPWQITGIQVVFSKPVTAGDVSSLTGVTTTGFSGLGTTTLTWTISPIADGNFTAVLAGAGTHAITDSNSNGLGAGAGYTQALKLLYGDFNDDGAVNILDQTAVLNITRGQPYSLFADMNGDGLVTTADVTLVRSQFGNTLP